MNMNLEAVYREPPASSTEAYRVWKAAMIPYEATVNDIAILLDSWVRENCTFTIVDGMYHACWQSPTGVAHDVPFDTILHWILCAAQPLKPVTIKSPPLQPAPAPVPQELSSLAEESSSLSSPSDPKPVPDSKPKVPKPCEPKPQRPDTPRPTIEGPLFISSSVAQ